MSVLPERLVDPLHAHLGRVKRLHEQDLREGYGEVALPRCGVAAEEVRIKPALYSWTTDREFQCEPERP